MNSSDKYDYHPRIILDGPVITDGNWPPREKKRVGLIFIATGRYKQYILPFLASAKKFFLNSEAVTFFLFTDDPAQRLEGVKAFGVMHRPWPAAAVQRYEWITSQADTFRSLDYLYYCDIDSEFVAPIGTEIFGELVATLHPRFWLRPDLAWFENRPESAAYVDPTKARGYYAGGFEGGAAPAFLAACAVMRDAIDADAKNGLVASWHDESHWNRYCVDHPPDRVLSPSYCFPDHCVAQPVSDEFNLTGLEPKILALTKPISFIRDREQ